MPENLFVYMVLTCTGWRQGWGRGEAYVKRRRGQNFCLRPEHLQIYDNDAPTMMYNLNIHLVNKIAFSALILLVWRQEEILAFKKIFEWWDAGAVQRSENDLHMVQLMPLAFQHLLLRMVFTFLVPAYPGCPGKEAVKQVFI